MPPLGYLRYLFIRGQQNENIVVVNTESFGDNIPDLIKSFGVDFVIWLYSRLKEDDVNLSLFFVLGA